MNCRCNVIIRLALQDKEKQLVKLLKLNNEVREVAGAVSTKSAAGAPLDEACESSELEAGIGVQLVASV